MLDEYGKELAKVSDGLVTMEVNPVGVLGPPPEGYDRVVKGVQDMSQLVTGYTPGLFPICEIVELPIFFPSAEITTKALIELYKKGYFDEEFAEVKMPFLHLMGPYNAQAKYMAAAVEAFDGKKMRCPGPTWVEITKLLGGVPVSLPVGETYTGLERGVIDGTWANNDQVHSFKLFEVINYINNTTWGGTFMAYPLNRDTYESLPEAVRKYIDDSFEEFSLRSAKFTDERNDMGLLAGLRAGNREVNVSETKRAKMDERLAPLFADWVAKWEAKGVPAKQALTDFYNALEGLGVEKPFPLPK